MSNIGTKIEKLIADGFSYNTLRGLSEAQVNLLYKRLIEAKPFQTSGVEYTPDEVRQMAQKGLAMPGGKEVKPTQQGGLIVTNEEEVTEDTAMDYATGYNPDEFGGNLPVNYNNPEDDTTPDVDGKNDGMPTEGEMNEKFESKSQQRLFWAKCNNSKSEKAKKKWCKWAKEYSDDTNFKKLPEKKKDSKLEEGLTKLIEKYIPESISKKELMSLIESSTRTKEAPTKTPTKTPTKKPGNPFRIKPHQKPSPKAELDEDKKKVEDIEVFYNKPMKNTNLPFKGKSEVKEGGAGAPAKAPVKTPTKTPSKSPGKKNPFKIEPAQKPGPKAKGPKWLSYNSFIKAGFNLK